MHRVITLSDSNYFDAGELFLKTKDRVNADFVLYGPDLNKKQVTILNNHNIEYIEVGETLFREEMQFLKFQFIMQQIERDGDCKYDGFTLVDFDTFFINDWEHIFNYDFDSGITIRNKVVKRKKTLFAYANGGVVFAKHSAYGLLHYAREVVINGYDKFLPEYDEIWKTLEENRSPLKTHYRTTLRWWVDQVFLSSLALHYYKKYGYHQIKDPEFFDFIGTKIGLFNCDQYNAIDAEPNASIVKNIYIRHLKSKGRKALVGEDRTVERL